jgi:hypothetical protein
VVFGDGTFGTGVEGLFAALGQLLQALGHRMIHRGLRYRTDRERPPPTGPAAGTEFPPSSQPLISARIVYFSTEGHKIGVRGTFLKERHSP